MGGGDYKVNVSKKKTLFLASRKTSPLTPRETSPLASQEQTSPLTPLLWRRGEESRAIFQKQSSSSLSFRVEGNEIEKSVTETKSWNGEYSLVSFRPKRSGVEKSIIEIKSGNGEYGEFIDLSAGSRGHAMTPSVTSGHLPRGGRLELSLRAGHGVNKKINSTFVPLTEGESEERAGGVYARRSVLHKTGLGRTFTFKSSTHGPLNTRYGKPPSYGKLAFTLVELIVVIVIVGVLATIGFLAFANYPKQARDTVRITHLREIEKAIEFYKIKDGDFPIPTGGQSNTGEIEGYSGIVWYKGTFGEDLANQIPELTKLPTDPKDNTEYTYELTQDLQSYRLTANLEIKHKDTGTKKYITKNKVDTSWNRLDSNCDKPDIYIGGQVWAGCNSTIGIGREYHEATTVKGYNYSGLAVNAGTTHGVSGIVTENGLDILKDPAYMGSTINAQRYYNKVKSPGNITPEMDNIWGKLYTRTNAINTACGGEGSGWHIPTDTDWNTLFKHLGCQNSSFNNTWQCAGLGIKDNNLKNTTNNLIQALKLPIVGIIRNDLNEAYHRGHNVYYFSSPNTTYVGLNWESNTIALSAATTLPSDDDSIISVRCIKD